MAVKIRARGAAAAEQDPKPTRKPAAKRTPAKRATSKRAVAKSAAKPAAKAAAPKRGGRPPKAEGEPVRRNKTSNIDPKEEAKLIKLVTKAGDRRRDAEEEHKESVNALHAAAKEALDAGVSMAKVADASGISRQWLYKMGEFADRGEALRAGGNGNGGSKPAARAAVKRTAPAKRTPAKTVGKATTGAKSSPRTRIRARA